MLAELVYKDIINTIVLLLEFSREVIININNYIDIYNKSNFSEDSNDETLGNI